MHQIPITSGGGSNHFRNLDPPTGRWVKSIPKWVGEMITEMPGQTISEILDQTIPETVGQRGPEYSIYKRTVLLFKEKSQAL
ncbi:MAG: hypothetical protein HC866_26530 [Leptolyngbyaceae cyanobacterium RU_5_1]|nr:hypothetical protein [Leptolyngbyaceae cyanobacterium RU_5_1]